MGNLLNGKKKHAKDANKKEGEREELKNDLVAKNGETGTSAEESRRWSVLDGPQIKRKVKDDYILGKKLGEGSYGKVREAVNKKTQTKVAVKSVLKKNMRRLHTLRREIEIMKSIEHPNVIKLYDVYEDEAFLYIVMEMCSGGELFDRIIEAGYFTEHDAIDLVRQVLNAVAYLHQRQIAHRDLKPENFLFQSNDPHAPLKLIDFGLSRFYKDNVMMKTRVGTPYYIAPEVLAKQYDKACDVWSVGVIMYILLCGYPPFFGNSEKQIFNMIRKGEFDFPTAEWGNVSSTAKDLIRLMLDTNPKTRISAEGALAHPWFAKSSAKPKMVSTKSHAVSNTIDTAAKSASEATLKPIDTSGSSDYTLASSNANVDHARSADQAQQPHLGVQVSDVYFDANEKTQNGDAVPLESGSSTAQEEEPNQNQQEHVVESRNSESLDPNVVDRLRKFAQCNRLKRAAIGVILRYLNREEINSLRDQFSAIDSDGNGVVSVNELAQAMRQAGQNPSASEVEKLAAALDEDGDGKIDYEEFLAATLDRHVYLRDELVQTAFHYFDTDGSGTISSTDLQARLGTDDPQLVQSILANCDVDHDGRIDFKEFTDMMNH